MIGWQAEIEPIQQRVNDTLRAARLTLGVPDGYILRPDGVFVAPVPQPDPATIDYAESPHG